MSEHQSQEYRGNGNHKWECVVDYAEAEHVGDTAEGTYTERLRVPGGWLYRTVRLTVLREQANVYGDTDECEVAYDMNTVFVPMPEVVKHRV